MALKKSSKANLRKWYPLYVEIGLIVALGIMITAFRVDWSPDAEVDLQMEEQEVVQMEEIQQTKQIEKPPPPPRPPVPVEVPNDEILEDEALNLDASLDLNEPAQDLPPPPPEEEEEEEEPEPEVFVVVENMPELIGGLGSIQKQIEYPEIARKAGVEGRVIVQFVVDENGNVQDPVVVRGIGAGCDEEALRVVREAKFQPGKQRGKPVKVKMSLPITFRLK
ncbi:MAG: TonB family protein [Bacteroidetes bacterium]|jgi:protein TonB|nr:TonB family protein [Bacteroidota bacterium]